jgi:hypothetical protein
MSRGKLEIHAAVLCSGGFHALICRMLGIAALTPTYELGVSSRARRAGSSHTEKINGQKRHNSSDSAIGGMRSMGFLVLGGFAISFIVWFG